METAAQHSLGEYLQEDINTNTEGNFDPYFLLYLWKQIINITFRFCGLTALHFSCKWEIKGKNMFISWSTIITVKKCAVLKIVVSSILNKLFSFYSPDFN